MTAERQVDAAFRSSFLTERTCPDPRTPLPCDDRVWLAANALKADFLKSESPLGAALAREIDGYLGCGVLPKAREFSSWLSFFDGIDAGHCPGTLLGCQLPPDLTSIPFAEAITPLIVRADEQFLRSDSLRFADQSAIAASVARYLCGQIAELACFTLYVEVAASVGNDLHRLRAEQNAVQYQAFCQATGADAWRTMIHRYPVLGRLIHERIKQTCDGFLVLCQRIRGDLDALDGHFDIGLADSSQDESVLPVRAMTFGLSDPHAGGSSVCRIEFCNGRRLVYKPKSMFNERWFSEQLIPALARHAIPLYAGRVIDRKDYGWVEDVTQLDDLQPDPGALSAEDVVGRTCALAFLLNASDLHCENVYIDRHRVFFLDLETLFTTATFMAVDKGDHSPETTVSAIATGLVREAAVVDAADRDPSGLFDASVASSLPGVQFVVEPSGALTMKASGRGQSDSWIDRQCFDIKRLDPRRVGDSFRDAVRSLTRDRDVLECIGAATEARARHVFRPTAFYFRLWQRLLQPRFLTDGALFSLELYRLFEELLALGQSEAAYASAVVRSEIKQLQNGDVPIFWVDFSSRALHSPDGLVQENFFFQTPFEAVGRKLASLSSSEIEANARVLETSLHVAQEIEVGQDYVSASPSQRGRGSCADMIVTLTGMLTDKIRELAFMHADARSTWISYNGAVDGKRLFPDTRDPSFYGGYTGIVCYLSSAREVLQSHAANSSSLDDFLATERQQLEALVQTEAAKSLVLPHGQATGLIGAGGVLLACAREGACSVRVLDPLADWMLGSGVDVVRRAVETDQALDVINGVAGFLIGAAAFASTVGKALSPQRVDSLTVLVRSAIRRLLATARQVELGVSWPHSRQTDDLVGISHGVLGIAAALATGQHALATLGAKDCDASETALALIDGAALRCDYFREPQSGLWLDRRSVGGTGGVVNTSWCHGLAGIGCAYSMLPRTLMGHVSALDLIASRLLKYERAGVDCFCCGEAGIIDFLLTMGRSRDDPTLLTAAEHRLTALISDWLDQERFRGIWGATAAGHFPGLFQGSAGIGYVALRSLNPNLGSIGMHMAI